MTTTISDTETVGSALFDGSNGQYGVYSLTPTGDLTIQGMVSVVDNTDPVYNLLGVWSGGTTGGAILDIVLGGALTVTASASGATAEGFGAGFAPASFTNAGIFSVDATSGATGVGWVFGGTFANSGSYSVHSAVGGATGVSIESGVTTVANTGFVTVSGATGAYGLEIYFGQATVTNGGTITVTSSGGAVHGVAMFPYATAATPVPAAAVLNTGTIKVSGVAGNAVWVQLGANLTNSGSIIAQGGAEGVLAGSGGGPAVGAVTIVNSGTITVTGGPSPTVGIDTGALFEGYADITNSGTITADNAIQITNGYINGSAILRLHNSGTLNGDVFVPYNGVVVGGPDGAQVFNSGHIVGDVTLIDQGTDLYDGCGGTLSGTLSLGPYVNLVYLGDDGETVAGGFATSLVGRTTVYGGAGADTFLGSLGQVTFYVGGGNDVLNGDSSLPVNASASDTVSFAKATSSVTVDLGVTGPQNTGFGLDTITRFQNLDGSAFADHLTGDANNNVIAGGGGSDTLTGGLGADTFVMAQGPGAVTITDFSAAQGDHIDVSALAAIHTFADLLPLIAQAGADTAISLPGGGSLTLDNVYAGSLGAATFGLAPGPASAVAFAPDDLNGSHVSDILLRAADGHWGYWSTATGFVDAGGSDTSMTIVGTGDFDGNGLADVVFRNNATGQWGYAQSTNGQGSPFVYAGLSDPNMHIEGVADFNGDGIPDVVFRNDATGAWGYAAMSHGMGDPWVYAGLSDPNYALAGIGDFNGDGIPDVLFRNNATGQVGYAAMSHGMGDPWVYIGLSDTHYTVGGVGDFNGDGIPDILMSNASSGDWGYVRMTHGQGSSWVDVGTLSAGQSIVGVGDYNGDGVSDVLIRNNTTGAWGYEAFTHGGMAWQPLPTSDPAFMVVA